MFVGRERELAQLNQVFHKKENSIVVLYGREGVGKTSLIKEFIRDKRCVYYQAREWSMQEQSKYYEEKRQEVADLLMKQDEKICFVVDEFDLMQKGYKGFFEEFNEYIHTLPMDSVMILFVSSNIPWVEKSMGDEIGELSGKITMTIKLKEFSFMEVTDRFPSASIEECIVIYSILGGVPGYLELWNPKESMKKNLLRLVIRPQGALRKEPSRYLKTVLRELPFYNTILTVLAEDEPKLNYLYQRTGFSRAKISVYIKNLTQMGVAGKIVSFEPEKKDIVQKGLYQITDAFLYFYYNLIYPHMTELEFLSPEEFYDRFLRDSMDELIHRTYMKVCCEFMELMNRFDKLPVHFRSMGSLYGKEGFVPLVASNEEGALLIGTCKWSSKPFDKSDFEKILNDAEQIGKDADYYYLFSKEGFTSDFAAMASQMDNIECIDLEQM
ncbi:MAG: ATP-binding protein [Eubacterium sp.]|nr:ATP-binding protein [Eubacterium sp.]